jgi:phosphoribosylformimino-5-aminoimidazole carboxamide ribonucleotide (ProFAR) isomerase
MNGWKTLTDMVVNADSIRLIEAYCSELLIHAADVEGLCQGIDEELVESELKIVQGAAQHLAASDRTSEPRLDEHV